MLVVSACNTECALAAALGLGSGQVVSEGYCPAGDEENTGRRTSTLAAREAAEG